MSSTHARWDGRRSEFDPIPCVESSVLPPASARSSLRARSDSPLAAVEITREELSVPLPPLLLLLVQSGQKIGSYAGYCSPRQRLIRVPPQATI